MKFSVRFCSIRVLSIAHGVLIEQRLVSRATSSWAYRLSNQSGDDSSINTLGEYAEDFEETVLEDTVSEEDLTIGIRPTEEDAVAGE